MAADISYTPETTHLPFEWSAAVQVLAGAAVLAALLASIVNIWKATRPVPPITEQIRDAIESHDAKSQHLFEEKCGQVQHLLTQMERRLDVHENCIRTIERTAAALEERTRRRT